MSNISVKHALASALALALAACGGPAPGTDPESPPDPPQDTARADRAAGQDAPPAPGAAAGGFAEGHPVPDEARPLLGEWVVAGHRFGAVAAMDDTAATRLHGREVSYGEAHANSGADSCGAPRYSAERRNVVETLLVDYRTSPMALGLDQATDAQVTVIDVECAQSWVTLGSRVLVLPDGLVLAPWDGVFFELRPR